MYVQSVSSSSGSVDFNSSAIAEIVNSLSPKVRACKELYVSLTDFVKSQNWNIDFANFDAGNVLTTNGIYSVLQGGDNGLNCTIIN